MLVNTIHFSYVRHRENQRYFARAIRELKPVFESLSQEVEEFVRVLYDVRFHSRIVSLQRWGTFLLAMPHLSSALHLSSPNLSVSESVRRLSSSGVSTSSGSSAISIPFR